MKTHRKTTTLLFCLLASQALLADSLEQSFHSPPDGARPHTWWHWLNGNVTKEGITKDLEAMKAVGLGGFQQFDVGLKMDDGPVAYNSPAFHELMSFSISEANRLGLEVGFNNASGWSSTGGPWIKPETSMKTLVWSEATLHGGDSQSVMLAVPDLREDQQTQAKSAKTDFYKDVTVLAFPTPKNADYRIENWSQKALIDAKARADQFSPDLRKAPAEAVVAADKVIDVSAHMDAAGKLDWKAPDGDWTVMRIGYSSTRAMNRPASRGGIGLEVDKLSRKAVDVHWNALIDRIIADANGLPALTTVLIDSYEVGMDNWTEGFQKEFQRRRGYDLLPRLLCVSGRVLDNTETTERVLWDLRTTVSELMQENYFGYFADKCHGRGLKLAMEPYGSGTFDALASALLADIPMTEFWQERATPMWQWTSEVVNSGAHLSGRHIVGAESFTSLKGDWADHPFSLKQMGDLAFINGVNRYYFHTWVHQPWSDRVKPGMTFGRFGGNFHRNNTWFPKSRAWMDYISRCQFIFQTGNYQADVLVLYGDERGFNNFLTAKEPVDMRDLPGQHFDLGGMSSLDRLTVDDSGDIRVTANGQLLDTRYKMLLLKRASLMTPENVGKLGALATRGAKIFAPKPFRSPSLENSTESDSKLEDLKRRYWDGGLIRLAKDFPTASAALVPDCDLPEPLRFNRHRIGSDDFYFISNQGDKPVEAAGTFRISGKLPELWNPLTGEITAAPNWQAHEDGRTEVGISLGPVDSLFVVFRKPATEKSKTTAKPEAVKLLELSDNWTVSFDPAWGPKNPVAFDQLTPWNEDSDEEVRYFSGTAVYKTTFELAKQPSPLVLDLGTVEVIARVTLNGKDLGTLWKPPFRVDIGKAVQPGANSLEIEVTSLWVNRLIGDERFPHHNKSIPDWVTSDKGPPADSPRKTFSTFPHWKKNDKLVPSGLVGPVVIEKLR